MGLTNWIMPPESELTRLTLRVRDLSAALAHYHDLLGLEIIERKEDRVLLAPVGKWFTLELAHRANAPLRPYPCVGLYHFALLLPNRPALARVMRRLLQANFPMEGFSDHGVSEAIYLSDPEGNGIELSCDRPKELWPNSNGQLQMYNAPLNIESLLQEAETDGPMDANTRLGHIHLQVANLGEAKEFYGNTLGLRETQGSLRGALFFAAGTYHHHVGANVWAGRRFAPPESTGLVSFRFHIPVGSAERLETRLNAKQIPHETTASGPELRDPNGIMVEIRESES